VKIKTYLFKIAVIFSGIIVIAIILFIFGFILFRGAQSISPEFIFDRPRGMPLGREGGIFPAIIGTIYLGTLSGLMAGIVGAITALYLVFYCQNKYIRGIISVSIHLLAGMPSILFGIIGYTILILRFGIPRSLLSASIAIAAMIVPFITIRIIKIFKEDVSDMLNSSLSLGLPKGYIIRTLILPNYYINILASITLGMAFGAGAAGPIIHTGAVVFAQTPQSLTSPFMALSNHLYLLVNQGISLDNSYGTALVLVVLLLSVNIICRALEHLRDGADWRFGKGKR